MNVEGELRRKRAEPLGDAEELGARIAAIDQVIAVPISLDAPERSAAAKPPRAKDIRQLPLELPNDGRNGHSAAETTIDQGCGDSNEGLVLEDRLEG